jgi:hypothetical protein
MQLTDNWSEFLPAQPDFWADSFEQLAINRKREPRERQLWLWEITRKLTNPELIRTLQKEMA